MNHWLHGQFTALITPFYDSGLDLAGLERLIDWQIAQGADGIVIGTATGEVSTLSAAEKGTLLDAARRIAGRHYPVIVATGSYATAATVAEAVAAERAGVSALLLRMPYYSRPTQAGLLAHIEAVAGATGLEIVLDNDPDRCGVEIALETLARLEPLANVVGILERRGDLIRGERIAKLRDRRFLRLTGAAETVSAYLLGGGCGAVTSLGNIAPKALARLGSAVKAELHGQAQILQRRLMPLLDLMAVEPDPVAVKLALSLIHPGIDPSCRLPLVSARPELRAQIEQAVADLPCPMGRRPVEFVRPLATAAMRR